MARPDPIQYAERLYEAIRAANFSPISFLAFGNAIKDGVAMRHMPRIAAEPFMRVVGEMLELEEDVASEDVVEVAVLNADSDSELAASGDPSPGEGSPGDGRSSVHPPPSSALRAPSRPAGA